MKKEQKKVENEADFSKKNIKRAGKVEYSFVGKGINGSGILYYDDDKNKFIIYDEQKEVKYVLSPIKPNEYLDEKGNVIKINLYSRDDGPTLYYKDNNILQIYGTPAARALKCVMEIYGE